MAHAPTTTPDSVHEKLNADGLKFTLLAAGGVGLVGAFITCFLFGGLRHFFLSYLLAFCFCLTFALGGLFFVLLQHATKAGWSVAVRRVPEALAGSFPILVVLALPLIFAVFVPGKTEVAHLDAEAGEHYAPNELFDRLPLLYPWAIGDDEHAEQEQHEVTNADYDANDLIEANQATVETATEDHLEGHDDHAHQFDKPFTELPQTASTEAVYEHLKYDELTAQKSAYLNAPFWTARLLIYLGVFWVIGSWYYRSSVAQDTSGDPELSIKMRQRSYPLLLVYALLLTVAAVDLIMSIDPHWYSTAMAPYFFAGSAVTVFATMAVAYPILLGKGLLKDAVNVEHLQDIGKFLFAFTFFWGYIAFSQYMLIWYGTLAEETTWYALRGATTVPENLAITPQGEVYAGGYWTIIVSALLFGHFLIPFVVLLSRHVKRNAKLLSFMGVWMLIFHWVDLYWLIMPEMPGGLWYKVPVVPILATIGVGGVFGYYALNNLTAHRLVPASDPRLPESLAFHNI